MPINYLQYVSKITCHCVEILRRRNATRCKITARAPPARRQTSARPLLGSVSLKRCVLMQRLRLFPGGDAVNQQGIVHSQINYQIMHDPPASLT